MTERRIEHYKSSQKILLVGEGNFSFSACLARAFHSAHNMVATSLDSLDTLVRKYGGIEHNLEELYERDCLVLHGVDVYTMHKHSRLVGMKFDVVVFNFPHAGHLRLPETSYTMIKMHTDLIRAFFKSAREMVKEGGEVHVTHRDDRPYNSWKLVEIARENGLILNAKVPFLKECYPGYHNKRGSEISPNRTFRLGECCYTFKFSIIGLEDQTLCEPTVQKMVDDFLEGLESSLGEIICD